MILAAAQGQAATNVAALVRQTVLVLAGIAAMIWTFRRARREPPVGVDPWRASLVDFGIWIWLICFAFYAGMNLFRFVYPAPPSGQTGGEYLLLRACIFQLSALAMQAGLLWFGRSFSPAPLNRANPPWRRIAQESAVAFLAAYPVVILTTVVWQSALTLAQKVWTHLETPLQEPVKILAQSSSLEEKALVILFAVIVAPVTEELFFRAGIYRFLKSRLPGGVALIGASLLFALFHFNLGSFLPLFVLGIFLAKLYERTGTIATPIMLHLLFNLVQIMLMFIFPDSTISAQPSS